MEGKPQNYPKEITQENVPGYDNDQIVLTEPKSSIDDPDNYDEEPVIPDEPLEEVCIDDVEDGDSLRPRFKFSLGFEPLANFQDGWNHSQDVMVNYMANSINHESIRTPENEFWKFLSYRRDLMQDKNIPLQEKRHLIKEALHNYYEYYHGQILAIKKTAHDLHEFLISEETINCTDIDCFLASCRDQYGLNCQYSDNFMRFADKWIYKKTKISEIREKYPDDKELFQASFGVCPNGKIEVISGAISIHFRIFDESDYIAAWSMGNDGVAASQIDLINLSGGAKFSQTRLEELDHCITIEKVSKAEIDGPTPIHESLRMQEPAHFDLDYLPDLI